MSADGTGLRGSIYLIKVRSAQGQCIASANGVLYRLFEDVRFSLGAVVSGR